jgi:hypothetical protein
MRFLPTTRRDFIALMAAFAAAPTRAAVSGDVAAIAPGDYFLALQKLCVAFAAGGGILGADGERLRGLALRQDHAAVLAAEAILERYTLARVVTAADGYARGEPGAAPRMLLEQGWCSFLVRVSNPTGVKAKLAVTCGLGYPYVSASITTASTGASRAGVPDTINVAPYVANAWLLAQFYEGETLPAELTGSSVEYRVIQIYSRDRGRRRAEFRFLTSSDAVAEFAAQELRRGVALEFECMPAQDVVLRLHDDDGRPCVASITISDALGRVYPHPSMRLAPDLQFQPQIYRADGESVRLPDGAFKVVAQRGPEYLDWAGTASIATDRAAIDVQMQRWIDPRKWGWYSGDPHVHAAGCAHYESPTEGVSPETMIRQVRGEALSVAGVLSWGPGWYYQKRFFSGHAASPPASLEHADLQAATHTTLRPQATAEDAESIIRYDVEVSGFPSSHCGHLVLLRLKHQDYPGTKTIQDWPTWNLPILQWARAQGAVVGYGHSGIGLSTGASELPSYTVPAMDGIGVQEAIVDVTHGAVDFLSGCDADPTAELNAWYHLLNCGYRVAMIGETDYPCITAERPGLGRTYVHLHHLSPDDAGYDAWVRNLRAGRLYCGDGRSHFLDFEIEGHRSGDGELGLSAPMDVKIDATVAAYLDAAPAAVPRPPIPGWGWHLESARIGATRTVAVDLVVNGRVAASSTIVADGAIRNVSFRQAIQRSSWVALRIFGSGHTYPVFVRVDGKPIRASRRSAEWCRSAVDRLWETRNAFIRPTERTAAAAAFDHARRAYDSIAAECSVA